MSIAIFIGQIRIQYLSSDYANWIPKENSSFVGTVLFKLCALSSCLSQTFEYIAALSNAWDGPLLCKLLRLIS